MDIMNYKILVVNDKSFSEELANINEKGELTIRFRDEILRLRDEVLKRSKKWPNGDYKYEYADPIYILLGRIIELEDRIEMLKYGLPDPEVLDNWMTPDMIASNINPANRVVPSLSEITIIDDLYDFADRLRDGSILKANPDLDEYNHG